MKELLVLKEVVEEFVKKAPAFDEEGDLGFRIGIAMADLEARIRVMEEVIRQK